MKKITSSSLRLSKKTPIYNPTHRQRDWCFTWNNYPKDCIDTLSNTLNSEGTYLVFGFENASTGTPHIQGYVRFQYQKSWQKMVKLLPGCHVTPRYEDSTPESAANYCKKDGDFLEWGGLASRGAQPGHAPTNRVWEQFKTAVKEGLTVDQLIELYPDLYGRYTNGFMSMYERMRPKIHFDLRQEYKELRPFQQEVVDYAKQEPDKRQILVIYDPKGNGGKSELADHLADNYGFLPIDNGESKDIAYQWNGENIVMDLAKSTKGELNYHVLEQLKNGRISSPKYQSCIKRFKRPHVIVFTNTLPDVDQLSLDRWLIKKVMKDYTLKDITKRVIQEQKIVIEVEKD